MDYELRHIENDARLPLLVKMSCEKLHDITKLVNHSTSGKVLSNFTLYTSLNLLECRGQISQHGMD